MKEKTVLSTGLPRLDRLLSGGFCGGSVNLIAGRPGMGTTALALQLARAMAKDSGRPVYYASLDTMKEHLLERLAKICGGRMQDAPIVIDHRSFAAPKDIAAAIGQIKDPCALIVDRLSLLEPDGGKTDESRSVELYRILRGLKRLAEDYDIPVICLDKVPRSAESREDMRPILSDLVPVYGETLDHIDTVTFLYREAYYYDDVEENRAEIILAQNRYGGTDKLTFYWDKDALTLRETDPGDGRQITAQTQVEDWIYEEAARRYGDPLPEIVRERLRRELIRIQEKDLAPQLKAALEIMENAAMAGCYAEGVATVDASLAAYLLGIGTVDPLPPHYRCPSCHYFDPAKGYDSGFDLPKKTCPLCGEPLLRDGHRIPEEMFFGPKGRVPCIDLRVSKGYKTDTERLLHIRVSGSRILSMSDYLTKFAEGKGSDCMDDPAVYRLFTSAEPLGIDPEKLGVRTGTLGIPEFGTPFMQELLMKTKPKNFAELLKVSGLSHGTNVWLQNGEKLLSDGTCDLSRLIASRDDVMNDLMGWGMDRETAWRIARIVYRGRAKTELTEELQDAMRKAGAPEWYIQSCLKIRYLFPWSHAVYYCRWALWIGWCKLYMPTAFYAAYFSAMAEEAGTETYAAVRREAEMRGIRFLPPDPACSHDTMYLPGDGGIREPLCLL